MAFIHKLTSRLGSKDIAVEMADSYRLLLVAKARWFIIGLLILHWLISFSTYVISQNFGNASLGLGLFYNEAVNLAFYPALVMLVAVFFNAFLHIGWYKLPSLWQERTSGFLFAQIIFDLLIVLALIHFTGGVTSWLWPLFLIINLELIYLFSSSKSIFLIGSIAGIGYTILGVLEYGGILQSYPMPYLPQGLQQNFSLVVLILIWVNLICGFSLLISLYLRRGEQHEIRERIIRDATTNLYNKKYFFDRLNSELQRSKIYNRVFSLILLEIDDFEIYVKSVGQGQANEMLRWVGEVLRMNIRRSEVQPVYELDIAAFIDDARFAVLLPETGAKKKRHLRDMPSDAEVFGAAAYTVAERIRTTVKSSKFTYGKPVTLSASIVSFPIDGADLEEIMISAQNGLSRAMEAGNAVVVVSQKIETEIELSKN